MNNPGIPFIEVVQHTIPWLFMRSASGIVITIGHLAFAVNVAWMFLARRPPGVTAPTLFRAPSAMQSNFVQ
jgi:cytochrome c oxidase cbb3-type subunit 1